MRLQGRVAIVTGSGGGIGKAIAQALAKEGAKVLVNDIDRENLEATVREINSSGAIAMGVVADVADPSEVQEMVNRCVRELGKVDILVNNAGGSGGDTGDRFLEGVPLHQWERMLDVNLKGTIHCTMAVLPHMMKARYGKIINISSQAGRYASELAGPYYSAAKGGQLAFTRQMALKLGPYGIYVNAVCPGVIISGPRVEGMWLARSEEERRQMLERIPLRRLGTPQEVASVVVFLASDESSYITGAVIDVNGGRFMA